MESYVFRNECLMCEYGDGKKVGVKKIKVYKDENLNDVSEIHLLNGESLKIFTEVIDVYRKYFK